VLETAQTLFSQELDFVERNYSIHELIGAAQRGRLLECFVCGTAFFITPVGEIRYEGRTVDVSRGDSHRESSLVERLRAHLMGIMHGEIHHPWAYEVEETGVPEARP
jgi:branched-chain amino acid aminotransferase